MTATKHSAHSWIVVDPVQDWEESAEIWGVYGSLSAAKQAARALRHRNYRHEWECQRDTEIQHWTGDELVDSWTWEPDKRTWRPGHTRKTL